MEPDKKIDKKPESPKKRNYVVTPSGGYMGLQTAQRAIDLFKETPNCD